MSFASDLDDFVEVEIPKLHSENVTRVEEYVYNRILSTSPVDTGAYRANHNRSEGKPDYSFSKSTTHGRQSAPFTRDGLVSLFVSNGAPYAKALEDGHSDQGKHIYASAYQSAKAKFAI